MDTEILETIKTRATANYLRKAGVGALPVGFDPTILVTIILSLLSGCKKNASEIKAASEDGDWKTQTVVRNATRRELRQRYGMFAYSRYDGDAIADAVLDTAQESSEEEIGQALDCC